MNSRGAELNAGNFENMWVYAYDLNAAPGTTGNGFEGELFTKQKKESNDFLSYNPLFWQAGSELRFFAINPVKADWHGDLVINKTSASFTNVNIPLNIEDQKDLVIGSASAKANNHMNGNGVELTLNHILSQINFKVKNTNKRLTYHIAAIRIVHAKNGGSYSFNPTQSQTGAWAGNPTGDVTYELDFNNNVKVLDGTDGKTEAFLTPVNNGAMLVMAVLPPCAETDSLADLEMETHRKFDTATFFKTIRIGR